MVCITARFLMVFYSFTSRSPPPPAHLLPPCTSSLPSASHVPPLTDCSCTAQTFTPRTQQGTKTQTLTLTHTHTKTERHRRCLIAALHQLAHPHPPNEPPFNSVFSQLHCYKRHQIHKINLKQLKGKHFKIKPQVGGEILFSAPLPSSEWCSHVSSRTKSVLEESNVYGLRKR